MHIKGTKGKNGKGKNSAPEREVAEIAEMRELTVEGATEHNLRGVDVTLPRNAMTRYHYCVTTSSGPITEVSLTKIIADL